MKRMKNVRVVVSFIMLFLVIGLVFPVLARAQEMPSKEEMVKVIEERLEVFPEIISIVPELSSRKKTRRGKGTVIEHFYTLPNGIVVKLEELDAELLYNLYGLVNRESTRLSTERITRQLEQQRQLRMLQTQQQQVPKPAQLPSVSRAHTPSSVPRPPSASAPPSVPARPPETPGR
jgi:hypothetical protein